MIEFLPCVKILIQINRRTNFQVLWLAVDEVGVVSFSYIQMLSLQSLSLICSKQPLSLPQRPRLCFITSKKPVPAEVSLWLNYGDGAGVVKTRSTPCIVHAVDKDSQQYEIDPDKAKDALQKLDQQLQELSTKKLNPPKIKASEVKLTVDQGTEEMQEIPGSVLAYVAAGLFLFTIFYNILFITVIKPSIDGP